MSDSLASSVPGASRSQPAGPGSTRRLMSLDALRGFDMFWIVGGEELVHGLYHGWPTGFTRLLSNQATHKAWEGVAFYDLIFPLFVFIVGVSLVFSLGRTIEQHGRAGALKRILFRTAVLYLFGLLVYGGLSKGIDHIRWLGVLQRIALCYGATGLLYCFFRPRALMGVCAAILVGYCLLCSLVPIRDFNIEKQHLKQQNLEPNSPETRAAFLAVTNVVRGRFDDGLTLPQHIDYQYLPGFKWDGAYDPEGILSTLPAICTCLLGVFAGLLLRNPRVSDNKKVLYLLAGGAAGVCLGFVWGLQFPVIKKIWTSSYVLVAAGYASLFLAAFHQVIEVWQWRRWCTPFLWIGMNPITIYLGCHFISFDKLSELFVGGPVKEALGAWGSLGVSVVSIGFMFAFVRFLYNRKIFLRL